MESKKFNGGVLKRVGGVLPPPTSIVTQALFVCSVAEKKASQTPNANAAAV